MASGVDVISSPIARSSTLAAALAIGLALATGPAAALGLGQIQVKSRPGQPLVAEIPIISSDPSELQGLQVQLASPETFSRVGLEPPQGLVSSLHFEPALDATGHPVVRVTSEAPVQQPLLTFLLEVDWAQGRLVREYSALVDAPRTVSAPLQPPIQAPVVAPPNTIARPATPVAAQPPAASTSAPPTATVTRVPPPAPKPTPVAQTPAPAAPVATARRSDTYGPVRPGQTLGEIAADLPGAAGYSAAQTMLALLRANPDAFIGGNINLLKSGAVLHLPPADEMTRLDQRQAAALVHEQIVQWREARKPPVQQAVVSDASAVATSERQRPAKATQASTRTADARLEIVPPSGRAANQARQSGIDAGGEGEMLRQQLQETKETLAARDAEVNELKSRVAELEKLQQQQQQLLTMKDSALAAAQQNLAKANNQPAAPVVSTAATQQQPAPAPPPQAQGTSIWLWGALVLVLTALAGWLFSRRRPRADAPPRRTFDTGALAASMTAAASSRDVAKGGPLPKASQAKPTATAPGPTVRPPWHAPVDAVPEVDTAAETPPPEATQKLEQAQAYLDLGDEDAARALLRDVLNGRDPAARDRAARLLRDL
jgi:pilus assembly protein FimV